MWLANSNFTIYTPATIKIHLNHYIGLYTIGFLILNPFLAFKVRFRPRAPQIKGHEFSTWGNNFCFFQKTLLGFLFSLRLSPIGYHWPNLHPIYNLKNPNPFIFPNIVRHWCLSSVSEFQIWKRTWIGQLWKKNPWIRFECVSKSGNSITTNPTFINKHFNLKLNSIRIINFR